MPDVAGLFGMKLHAEQVVAFCRRRERRFVDAQ